MSQTILMISDNQKPEAVLVKKPDTNHEGERRK